LCSTGAGLIRADFGEFLVLDKTGNVLPGRWASHLGCMNGFAFGDLVDVHDPDGRAVTAVFCAGMLQMTLKKSFPPTRLVFANSHEKVLG